MGQEMFKWVREGARKSNKGESDQVGLRQGQSSQRLVSDPSTPYGYGEGGLWKWELAHSPACLGTTQGWFISTGY